MRLTLELPAEAQERIEDDTIVVTFPAEPSLRIEIGALQVGPTSAANWMKQTLTRGVADPSWVRVLGSARVQTRDGWTCEIVDAIVNGPSTEHRLVGMYEMLDHLASVCVRISDSAIYHDKREALVSLMLTARPSWRSRTPVAVAELWNLKATRPND